MLAIFAFCTFFVQMFCNIDSYLYSPICQGDSAVFYMCGKAMMNGMTPYTDFTDSKGVLLWFIYGVGYLLDNYSYVGVFWIMCCFLFVTLCIAYKTARLFLPRQLSVYAALFLLVPLMYWNFYHETKAEHFCWPIVAWGLYVLMKSLAGRNISNLDYFGIGFGVVACLMIKWNIAVMMFCFVFSVSWLAYLRGEIKHCMLGVSLGALLTFIPFAVYFTIAGNWTDMWQEYFVNTFQTVTPMDNSLYQTFQVFFTGWKRLFTTRMFIYLLYIFPVLTLWKRERWFSSVLPFLCGLFFVLLATRANSGSYYISVAGPFAIMTIIVIIKFCQRYGQFGKLVPFFVVLSLLYDVWGSPHYLPFFCTKHRQENNQFMALSAKMSEVSEHPTVITVGMEPGLCMGSALPGTRYWTLQVGCTPTMWKDELSAIKSNSADFIIIVYPSISPELCEFVKKELKESDYHYFADYFAGCVYTKHNLNMPEKIKDISIKDIVLNRTYKEIYEENHDTGTMFQ